MISAFTIQTSADYCCYYCCYYWYYFTNCHQFSKKETKEGNNINGKRLGVSRPHRRQKEAGSSGNTTFRRINQHKHGKEQNVAFVSGSAGLWIFPYFYRICLLKFGLNW